MSGFTKQEKPVIVLLLLTLITGAGINLSRSTGSVKHEKAARKAAFLAEKTVENSSSYPQSLLMSKKRITGRINVNTATMAELQTLPRIGPVLAESIIAYREQYGPFKSINELKNVKRIGNKTLNKIKKSITL